MRKVSESELEKMRRRWQRKRHGTPKRKSLPPPVPVVHRPEPVVIPAQPTRGGAVGVNCSVRVSMDDLCRLPRPQLDAFMAGMAEVVKALG